MFPKRLASVTSIASILAFTYLFALCCNRGDLFVYMIATDEARYEVEPIVLTMVFMGSAAAREGLTTIKSAIMYSSRPLVFHLICSEDAIPVIEPRIAQIQRPYYSLDVVYHIVPESRVKERLERAGVGVNWSFLTKLLVHEILVGVKRAVYVDADMIFAVDPVQLWDTFSSHGKDTLISLPTLGSQSHAGQICTCVMLMELERMRNPDILFLPSTNLPDVTDWFTEPIAAAQKNGIPSVFERDGLMPFDPMGSLFGDQGLYYVLWLYRPHLFGHLSLRWDITGCRESYGLLLGPFEKGEHPEEMAEEDHLAKQGWRQESGEDMLFPGILHFNCQPEAGSNVWEWHENHEPQQTWSPLVSSTVLYKWIWLNRGNGSAKATTRKIVRVTWLDEMHKADRAVEDS